MLCSCCKEDLGDLSCLMQEFEEDEDTKALSIITGELARAIQFGEGAENPACVTDLKNIAVDFHIDYKKLKDEGIEEEDEDE